MPSLVHLLKNTPVACRILNAMLARRLDASRATDDPSPLATGRLLGAVERRTLQALAAGTSSPARQAFAMLRDAFVLLRDRESNASAACDWNRRLVRLERAAREVQPLGYPTRCYVELTTQCNLRCPICSQSHYADPKRDTMTRADIDRIAPLFPWMDEISVFGFGESLLVPFLDQVLDAIPPETRSVLNTNGILLTSERGRMLVDHGLKILRVSIDGVERETYRRTRGVDRLETVLENVRTLVDYKKTCGSPTPELHFVFVAMRSNIAELPACIRLAAELGARCVAVAYLVVVFENLRNESLFYHQDLAQRHFALARQEAERLGIQLDLPPGFDAAQGDPAGGPAGRQPCVEPWEFVYFRADGGVAPCCMYTAPYGNWREQTFEEYWNSNAYRRLRATLHTPQEPRVCRQCSHFRLRDPRDEASHIRIDE